MNNSIGIISMHFVRPFTDAHFVIFQRIKAIGFDYVELLVPEPDDNLGLGDVSDALAEAGLDVLLAARVNVMRSIASDHPPARQGGLDYLDRCIDVAEALGARIIGGPIYGEPLVFAGRAPVPRTADEMKARADHMIEGLSRVAPKARAAGKVFALEPLNRFETDMISTTTQGIRVVDLVNDAGLGLCLDTFHMNIEDRSIADAIRAAGRRIVHFQANENHRGYPGTGHIDWPSVMSALAQAGYVGPISLEPFRRDDQRIALPIARWRAPVGNDDDKLKAGLALIRSALMMAEHDQ